jgi:diguanylate cyclase (GGDEF)-like protein/PAS domain S-box-containing protein
MNANDTQQLDLPLALIVDDDLMLRLLLRQCLERAEFRVAEAGDGACALAAYQEHKPDIVLLDVLMPEMDGYAACRELRRLPEGAQVPVLMMTGLDDVDSINAAYEAGATDFITKPITWPLLPHRVRYLLRAARAFDDVARSRERLAEAQRIARLGALDWDVQHDILRASEEVQRIFGVYPQNAAGTWAAFLKQVHITDRACVEQALTAALDRKSAFSLDHAIILPDGSQRVVHTQGELVFDEAGKPVRLRGTVQDITERKQQEQKIARLNRVYAVLSGINSAIVRIHDRDELLREACRIAVEQGEFKMAWIGLPAPGGGKIQPVAWAGCDAGYMHAVRRKLESLPEDYGLGGRALREKKVVYSNDIAGDARIVYKMEALARGFHSVIMLPLLPRGETAGLLALYSEKRGFFDEDELRLLNELAGDISFGLEAIAKEEKLAYLAYYDALTGLPNRTLFCERVNQSLNAVRGTEAKAAVMAIDLERFRLINDTLGRHAGDGLLDRVAERLRVAIPGSGVLARIGADCFAAAVPLKQEAEIAVFLESTLHQCFSTPFAIGDNELRLSAKSGIALFPNDGPDCDALLKNAEAALKKAKNTPEQYLFYTPEMNARVAERLTLENKLRSAIDERQFVLYYQPKVDLESRSLRGLEALIRWRDSEAGLIPPSRFIPILEETGLILEVGRWVLKQAIADYRDWQQMGLEPPRVAINVSALELRRKDFILEVSQAIAGAGTSALELEITESLIMEDIERNIGMLKEIRDLGVGIAIDDFGTGYSSLSYIARLPVEVLKIDRSFVTNLNMCAENATIIHTIISLAHSLKLRVVAEGVETEEQASLLKRLKCDLMQGYLVSQPVPREKIEALLQAQKPGAGTDRARPRELRPSRSSGNGQQTGVCG